MKLAIVFYIQIKLNFIKLKYNIIKIMNIVFIKIIKILLLLLMIIALL